MTSERTAHNGWGSNALHTIFQWLSMDSLNHCGFFAASELWQCTAASCAACGAFHEGTEVGQGKVCK